LFGSEENGRGLKPQRFGSEQNGLGKKGNGRDENAGGFGFMLTNMECYNEEKEDFAVTRLYK
jgi:hypothetical protein